MKKSLLALVVLGAFAGAASAQSSVTIFGKIDQAVGKTIGSKDKQVMDNAGSRIAFRGYEDLGGGMGALFAFEHRFAPDTGNYGGGAAPVAATTTKFWEGFSFVGLRTPYGALTVGRQYTSSFLTVQNQIDPFAGETVAKLRDIGMGNGAGAPAQGAPGQIRVANSLKYALASSGFTFSADIAEATGPDRPYSVAGSYQGGPFWVGISYEDPTGETDELLNLGGRYTFGTVTLSAGLAEGKRNTAALNKVRGDLVGANIAVGTGDIKIGHANLKIGGTTLNQRTGLGYHHNLSKRTKLFVDVAHDSKATTPAGDVEKLGYDLGIQHNF